MTNDNSDVSINDVDAEEIVFSLEERRFVSSGSAPITTAVSGPLKKADASLKTHLPLSPVDAQLAAAELPALPKENRARLQMQTPTRLFFYWTFRQNPQSILKRAVGGNGAGYQLVIKLLNLTKNTEEIHAVDGSGSWWFNVDADCGYRGEVGYYAPNKPFIRIMYSNNISTPRRRPSPRVATDSDWRVSTEKFATILNASGFKQDAFDFAVRGDNIETDYELATTAFEEFLGRDYGYEGIAADELRYALFYTALGLPLEALRWRIDAALFRLLQANSSKLSAERAARVVKEHFGVEVDEIVEEEIGPATYGTSVVHFPRILRKRHRPGVPSYEPISSSSR